MPTPNMRTVQLLGSLVALNFGLFVFNNLPLVQVPRHEFKSQLAPAREATMEIRQRAREARLEARAAIDRAQVEVRKQQGRRKLDHLTCLHQLNNFDRLRLSVDVPPPMPAIVLPPQLRGLPSGRLPHVTSRRVTLHEYFRDRML